MRRAVFFLACFVPCLLAADPPVDEPLRTAADRPVDIRHIRLDLQVDLPKKTVDGTATILFRTLRSLRSFALNAVDFQIRDVQLQQGEKKVDVLFDHDGKLLTIDFDSPWKEGVEGTLIIHYRICNPKAGLHFFGPSEADPNVPLTVWSHGESYTNRYWFPCFDYPDQRQTTEVVVTVPEGFEALSNGKLVDRKVGADKQVTFHWKQDQPHVSYLVTLVVGQFDVVEEEWHKRPVLYYVPKGHREEIARSFGRTPEMLTFFSKRFGIEFPWDKYAQVVVEQYSAGGMEHTSATTLNDRALHDSRAFLDSTPDDLIAHELGHQWWGDLLTCRDWAHIWLNEGFASYSEILWSEHQNGPEEAAYRLVLKGQAAMKGDKERPIVDRRYSSPDTMFDARAYPKGAWVLQMLRRQLGEEDFWRAIQRYGTEHRLCCVETSDLRKTFERETGRNLERFFYDWTERPGHPVLDVASTYLPDTKQLRVAVKQTQSSEAFHFPLTVAYSHGESKPTTFTEKISTKEQILFIPVGDRPTYVSLDPEQALLAEIKENKSREWWLNQLKSGDVAARIRAAEHFGKEKTSHACEALAQALKEETFWGVAAQIASSLSEGGDDVCRDALIEGLSHANPKVRRACAEHLDKFPANTKVATALKQLLEKGDASYFVEAAALSAYAKSQQPDVTAVLLPWLAKPSYGEVLRTAVLGGLAKAKDLTSLDAIISWTKPGKPHEARRAALSALAKLTRDATPTDAQRQKMVEAVTSCLKNGEGTLIRRAAVTALRDMGQAATPSLETLEALAQYEPDTRLRSLAEKAVEKIHNDTSTPVEVTRLREELQKLHRSQEELRERLERYEKIERKGVKEMTP